MKATSQKRYPWLISLLATLGMIVLALASLVIYTRVSDDRSPFGLAGLAYGIAGLLFMGLATLAYTLFRHSRKRVVGALNASLYWHISFGIVALFLIFLHSFGNFEQISGTYALYALMALVISGITGRMLDRFLPRLIARSVSAVLTEQGDDRIESVTRRLQDMTSYQKEQVHSFTSQPALLVASRDRQAATNRPTNSNIRAATNHLASRDSTALPTSWDLADILQEKTLQETERNATHHRFISDRKSTLPEPQALMPGLKERMEELQDVQRALQRERFYRAVIRYWRIFHICLSLLTIGLTLWHLEYAATILYPIWFYH